METNFCGAGSMRSGMNTHISTSVRPNHGSSWFNWADAWEEEIEEEKKLLAMAAENGWKVAGWRGKGGREWRPTFGRRDR